jgi:hypothetical protein
LALLIQAHTFSGLAAGALAGQSLFIKPVKVLGDPDFIGTAANPLNYDSTGPNWVEGREVEEPHARLVNPIQFPATAIVTPTPVDTVPTVTTTVT